MKNASYFLIHDTLIGTLVCKRIKERSVNSTDHNLDENFLQYSQWFSMERTDVRLQRYFPSKLEPKRSRKWSFPMSKI